MFIYKPHKNIEGYNNLAAVSNHHKVSFAFKLALKLTLLIFTFS
jgi:hypothetical protein